MRWETIKSTPEQEVYYLMNGEKKELTLVCNPFSNSARIECNNEKRIFLIRKEGFRRKKTVIRNEYGVKLGELGKENKKDFILIGSTRLFYRTRTAPAAELILFKETDPATPISCALDNNCIEQHMHIAENPGNNTSTGLLMALCWYLLLPLTTATHNAVPESSYSYS